MDIGYITLIALKDEFHHKAEAQRMQLSHSALYDFIWLISHTF